MLDFIIRKRIYLLYLEAKSLQRRRPPDRRWRQEPAWPTNTSSSALAIAPIRVFQLTHSLQIVPASAGRSRKRFNVAKSKSDPTPNLVVAQQSSNGKSRNRLKVWGGYFWRWIPQLSLSRVKLTLGRIQWSRAMVALSLSTLVSGFPPKVLAWLALSAHWYSTAAAELWHWHTGTAGEPWLRANTWAQWPTACPTWP